MTARRLTKLLLGLLGIIIAYYAVVMIIGYVQTPKLVAARTASAQMALAADQLSAEHLHILLTVEDPNFFSHNGVDLSTPGAGLTTITQALAKDLYFEEFRPGLAKLKQSLLALALDQRVDKWQQLDLFINTAYFGNHEGKPVHGFAAAARTYFNKEFAELTREEYIALVAMLIAPNDLSLAAHPDANVKRVRRIERLLRAECQPTGLRDVYYENCGE